MNCVHIHNVGGGGGGGRHGARGVLIDLEESWLVLKDCIGPHQF